MRWLIVFELSTAETHLSKCSTPTSSASSAPISLGTCSKLLEVGVPSCEDLSSLQNIQPNDITPNFQKCLLFMFLILWFCNINSSTLNCCKNCDKSFYEFCAVHKNHSDIWPWSYIETCLHHVLLLQHNRHQLVILVPSMIHLSLPVPVVSALHDVYYWCPYLLVTGNIVTTSRVLRCHWNAV